MSTPANYLSEVRGQYEDYPYPPRDPESEHNSILRSIEDNLAFANQYGYRGRKRFTDGFRALVAGGGTGDSLIYLGYQLERAGGDVHYIDLSTASMAVAKARAKVKELTCITWHHGSLLDLPEMGLGQFDFINCTGVLHHLEDPSAGLRALRQMLKPDGLMFIMVYAQYGRTGIYQMQELMRLLNANVNSAEQKIANTMHMLDHLPKTNWFQFNRWIPQVDIDYGKAGVYDMLLHSHDRAYTVPEFYEFVENEGLNVVTLNGNIQMGKQEYNPKCYVRDPQLIRQFGLLPLREKQAVAEILCGTIIKHCAYVSQQTDTIAQPDSLDYVPFVSLRAVQQFRGKNPLEELRRVVADVAVGEPVQLVHHFGHGIHFTKSPHLEAMCRFMDEQRNLGEIFAEIRKETPDAPDDATLLKEFEQVWRAWFQIDLIHLRA